jgi:uncharacterized protein YjbI with pentapeptide repeats
MHKEHKGMIQAIGNVGFELLVTLIVALIFLIMAVIIGIWSRSQHNNLPQATWLSEFLRGLSLQLLGLSFIVLILGGLFLIFQQYGMIQNRKSDLIIQMGSPNNDFAIEAVRQLSALGWLDDTTLHHAFLQGANLSAAMLEGADLSYANLWNADFINANLNFANLTYADLNLADLSAASLRETNLSNANLRSANLSNADLYLANLSEATLVLANLSNADLENANLNEANLENADLSGANLRHAEFSNVNLNGVDLTNAHLESTFFSNVTLDSATLPDGTQWTSDTDFERFTNPNHPENWYCSGAYDFRPAYCP